MVVKSTQSRGGVKGQLPLAESRGGASGGAWGNAPTVTPLNLLKEKSQAWHLGRRQRSVPAHKLPLPQERNPPATQKINYENVHPKQSRGRPQTSSVSIAPLSPPQRRNPLQHKKSTCLNSQSRKHHCLLPPRRIFPMQKIPRLSHNRRRKLMQTLLEK